MDKVAGQLPRPISQSVGDFLISWQWLPLGEYRVSVKAQFDRNDGSWHISIKNVGSFSPEEAKLLGEALLSAYNWKDIWKLHFADMFLEMDGVESSVKNFVGDSVENSVGNSIKRLNELNGPNGPCGVTGCDA